MIRVVSLGLVCCLAAGCTTIPLKTDGSVGAEEVMRRIKDELSEYYFYMHQHENDPALDNVCKGKIEFEIKSVTVTLTSQSDDTADVNGSASLPIGAAGTLGPTLDLSSETKSTKTLKYTVFPTDPRPSARPPALKSEERWVGYPIASSIEQLREALLKASDTLPCETFAAPAEPATPPAPGKPAAPADQTVSFDFNVIRTGKGGATFKFVLFSVGATASRQRQAGNTVLVTFNAKPGSVGFHSRQAEPNP